MPSPWLDMDKGRRPRYCMNCENKKPLTTLVCVQRHRWMNTTGMRVVMHTCPSRGSQSEVKGHLGSSFW